MTPAFIVEVRILLPSLVAFCSYRLWVGSTSWTARGVGVFFSAVLVAQILVGAL
jgi:hypothetical protein